MATWTQLDTAIGRLKIQLVLTEPDTARSAYWYAYASKAIDLVTEQLQRANQQARDPGELDAIGVERPTVGQQLCNCDADLVLPHEPGPACGQGVPYVEPGPRRAGERPYQPTGRPAGHGEPAYETTDPAQPSTLPPTSDNTREP